MNKRKEARNLVSKLKEMCIPVVAGEQISFDDTCVGGALCVHLIKKHANYSFALAEFLSTGARFPSDTVLADFLIQANDKLDCKHAQYFSSQINKFNDNRYFINAWQFLEEALSYDPPKCGVAATAKPKPPELKNALKIVRDIIPYDEYKPQYTPEPKYQDSRVLAAA